MKTNRRQISYIEDIIEEAFGEVTPKNLEMINLFFNYIIEEQKNGSDSLGYRLPWLGNFYQDFALLRATKKYIKTEEDELEYINRVGELNYYSDEMGGKSNPKQRPHVHNMEWKLRKKYELPKGGLAHEDRIPPLFLMAVEDLQNKNFEKHKQKNE